MSEEKDTKHEGDRPEGASSEGASSEGAASEGAASEGAASEGAASEGASSEGGASEGEGPTKERVDADGLPLDREATIDDVRSTEARHGRIALGCTVVIVLFIVLFWLVRGGFIG